MNKILTKKRLRSVKVVLNS